MKNTSERMYILDLLRFVAALFVVFYHYIYFGKSEAIINSFHPVSEVAKYGHLGVQLFFMISGFVISWSAVGKSGVEFLLSRIVRLYPAYWGALLITSGFLFFKSDINISDFLVNLTMLQQFVGVPHIDGSYWTLTNEIVFYGFVFILISLNLFHHMTRVLSFLLFASLIFWLYVTKTGTQPPVVGTLFMLEYIAYFAAGSIFYDCLRTSFNSTKIALLVFCFGISLFDGFHMYQESFNGVYYEKSFTIIALTILLFFVLFTLISYRLITFNYKWLSILGAISYPLYLIHQRVGLLILDDIGFNWSNVIYVTLGMIAFSYFFYVIYERKVANVLKRLLFNCVSSKVLVSRFN